VTVERVNPPSLGRPSGFSHAAAGSGRVVFLSGQTATDATGAIAGDDITAQFDRALRRLLEALRAAGGRPADLASLTIYAVDLADYQAHGSEIGRIWRKLAGRDYPAMAAVQVSRLWDPAALVELQGQAILPRE
jgi:enamine deaminase RidA (YjgF/YER057c/UK114 family)